MDVMTVIHEAVKKYDKNLVLKDKQREALTYVVKSKCDLVVSLPVGYGKSVIFHLLPLIFEETRENPVVLVISPLNIIQKDQLSVLKEHGISSCRLDIVANVVHGLEDDKETEYMCKSDENFEDVKHGKFQIVFCHPEALFNTNKGRELLNGVFNQHVVSVVIDECHIIEKWGEEFRLAFKALPTLKAFFPDVTFLALSGTLTITQKQDLPKMLGLNNFKIIECSPDKPNIYLEKFKKEHASGVEEEYENIVNSLCDKLFVERKNFPVTLIYVPVYYMSRAIMYLNNLFKPSNINDAIYSAICSGQDQYVIDRTMQELKKEHSLIRLVLTTSILGMGFDPENVTHVVHSCPPRNISQYFQEVGRAGRRGQPSVASLYYSARNIARNLPGITEDIIQYCKNDTSCLRNCILSVFGFQKNSDIVDCKCCCICKKNCNCDDCLIANIVITDSY